jgi:hypothetical protein
MVLSIFFYAACSLMYTRGRTLQLWKMLLQPKVSGPIGAFWAINVSAFNCFALLCFHRSTK